MFTLKKGKKLIKEYFDIEEEFFVVDKENGTAKVSLLFDSADDLFDGNYLAKRPILSDGFLHLLREVFDFIPDKYRIELDIRFKDMKGMTDEKLNELFNLNMLYGYRAGHARSRRNDHTAFGLIGTGLVFFLGMLAMNRLWVNDSIFRDICTYIADIATTVTFWEALNILVVMKREQISDAGGLIGRFSSIHFSKA